MPIYEFRCGSCGHRFEKLCSMGETGQNISCPKCNTAKPERVMSGFAARSTDSGGDVSPIGGGGGCSGCSSTNCGSCGH